MSSRDNDYTGQPSPVRMQPSPYRCWPVASPGKCRAGKNRMNKQLLSDWLKSPGADVYQRISAKCPTAARGRKYSDSYLERLESARRANHPCEAYLKRLTFGGLVVYEPALQHPSTARLRSNWGIRVQCDC